MLCFLAPCGLLRFEAECLIDGLGHGHGPKLPGTTALLMNRFNSSQASRFITPAIGSVQARLTYFAKR